MGAYITSAALQPDGKVVVFGRSTCCSGTVTSSQWLLQRFTTTGSLDATFGTGGTVTDSYGLQPGMQGIALQADGKILVTGLSYTMSTSTGAYYSSLSRYNPDGSLDTAFGSGGRVTPVIQGNNTPSTILVQSDGRIIVSGSVGALPECDLARYQPNGALDKSFGTSGFISQPPANESFVRCFAGALDGSNNIFVAGTGFSSSSMSTGEFLLLKYLAQP